jgi:hypothetical protein
MATSLNKKISDRVAYDFDEFAQLFGHDRAWSYRMAKGNKVRTIKGYGKMMIPASEVERIARGEEAQP